MYRYNYEEVVRGMSGNIWSIRFRIIASSLSEARVESNVNIENDILISSTSNILVFYKT